jgi:hypothetical protein
VFYKQLLILMHTHPLIMMPQESQHVAIYYFNTNNSDSPIVHLFGFKKVLISM